MSPRLAGPIALTVLLLVGYGLDQRGNTQTIEVAGITSPTTTSADVGAQSRSSGSTTTTLTTDRPGTTATETTTTGAVVSLEGLDQFADVAARRMNELTIEEVVAQLFVVELNLANAPQSLEDNGWGGVFLSMENEQPDAVRQFIDSIQKQSFDKTSMGLIVSSDVEGGRIVKMPIQDALLPGDLVDRSDDEITSLNRRIAGQLCSFGTNLNLAPVGDVDISNNPVLKGGRSFGTDAAEVARFIELFIDGYTAPTNESPQIATTTKHFPGHGAASTDSHKESALVGSRESLEAQHLEPFRTAIELYKSVPGVIMIGHLVVDGQSEPATFSQQIVDGWLRDDLGHEGLIISDDLANMAAITDRPVGDRAADALMAGIDLLLWNDAGKAQDARIDLLQRVQAEPRGMLADRVRESATRILQLKTWLGLLSIDAVRCGGASSQ